MTGWTDAARAASLAVREAEAKNHNANGKRAGQETHHQAIREVSKWYHGDINAIRGQSINAKSLMTPSWAVTNLKSAYNYATQASYKKSLIPERKAIFSVRPITKNSTRMSEGRGRGSMSKEVIASPYRMSIVSRLPQARGHASRGKY
jgi:hypothetical protein